LFKDQKFNQGKKNLKRFQNFCMCFSEGKDMMIWQIQECLLKQIQKYIQQRTRNIITEIYSFSVLPTKIITIYTRV